MVSVKEFQDDLDVYELNELKRKLKELNKKIKEKNKPKTITISTNTHDKIKSYCSAFNLNIGKWVEEVLLERINEKCVYMGDMTFEEIQEKETEEIKRNYIKELNKDRDLIKTSKILINKDLEFFGYSIVDALPIYNILSNNNIIRRKLTEKGITFSNVLFGSESSPFINYNENLDVEILPEIDLDEVIKVKFLKKDEVLLENDVMEKNVEFDDLIKLIREVEKKTGLGKSLHEEAFTGIDYLGNKVNFCAYVIWTERGVTKYNFEEKYVPFNEYMFIRIQEVSKEESAFIEVKPFDPKGWKKYVTF